MILIAVERFSDQMKSSPLLDRRTRPGCLAAAVIAGAAWSYAVDLPPPQDASSSKIERGKYVVERVALCADCHTERDWKGRQPRERWLEGARLNFKPTKPMPWAELAPRIAGLPMFAMDDQAVKYFMTGVKQDQKPSKPPMPQYRLNPDDAEAVVAYLRSLKPANRPPAK